MVTSCGRAFDLEILGSSVDTSSFLVELCGITMYLVDMQELSKTRNSAVKKHVIDLSCLHTELIERSISYQLSVRPTRTCTLLMVANIDRLASIALPGGIT